MAERVRWLSEPFAAPPGDGIPPRRVLAAEVVIVLSLSLLPSAVDSLFSLLAAPVSGVRVFLYSSVPFLQQLADIAFTLAPVALVVYLAERNGEGLRPFGLGQFTARDAGSGVLLGLGVASIGIGLYLGSVALRLNRFVVPVPPLGHWWTIPILVLGALQAALLEEVIAVGYLIRRLEQLRWPALAAICASAVLRGSYHLYQGWGGFTGNLILGLLFGWLFVRWRRLWPLVVAHFSIDLLAGIAYLVFRGHCFLHACIR